MTEAPTQKARSTRPALDVLAVRCRVVGEILVFLREPKLLCEGSRVPGVVVAHADVPPV